MSILETRPWVAEQMSRSVATCSAASGVTYAVERLGGMIAADGTLTFREAFRAADRNQPVDNTSDPATPDGPVACSDVGKQAMTAQWPVIEADAPRFVRNGVSRSDEKVC